MGKPKKTLEDVRIAAEAINAICLSTEYINNKSPLFLKCNVCGNKWDTTYNRLSKGVGCAQCAGNKPLTLEYINKFISAKEATHNLTKYKRCSDSLIIFCKNGHKWPTTVTSIIHNDYWCPECSFDGWTIEDLQKYAFERGGMCLSTVYTHNHDRYRWKCGNCPNEWDCTWVGMIQYKTWCRRCANRSLMDSDIKQLVQKRGYTLLNLEYRRDSKTGFSRHWLHLKCQNIAHSDYWIRYDGFSNGVDCATCSGYGASKAQIEIYEIIKSICPDTELEYEDLFPNSDKIVDIVTNSKKIANEYLGLIWHSEQMLERKGKNGRKDNYNRYLMIKNVEYRPVIIFENEWIQTSGKVKGYLRAIYGDPSLKRVGASKCKIKKEMNLKPFLEENHIQGKTPFNEGYGLYYKDELIACMTMRKCGKKHRGAIEEGVWDLNRYCIKIGYAIPGGLQRLLKVFIREYNPKSIISFSDNRWSQGQLYENNGFKRSWEVKPTYYYFKSGQQELYHKSLFQKSAIRKKFGPLQEVILEDGSTREETEFEAMDRLGYFRIWDCGKQRWEMKLR